MNRLSETIILIPTYNEKDNIASLIKEIFRQYPEISILVLDDGSPDKTPEIVENLQDPFFNLYLLKRTGPRGLGKSYIDGFNKISGNDKYRYIVMMDADFSHNPKEINKMLSKLEYYDVINGSRYVKGGRIENWKWYRRLLSRFANFYARKILGVTISDMTTGFICLRKEVIKKIDLDSITSDGYAFLVELKCRLLKAGAKFCEHPIVYTERREGESKMSSRIIWESIWLPWKLRFKIN